MFVFLLYIAKLGLLNMNIVYMYLYIFFIFLEVPEMPKNIRVNDQQSRSLQISWTQPYAGNSPITSYIIQYKLVSGKYFLGIFKSVYESVTHFT